jgi:hypothetical protein
LIHPVKHVRRRHFRKRRRIRRAVFPLSIIICGLIAVGTARQVSFSSFKLAAFYSTSRAATEWTQGDPSRNLALLAGEVRTGQSGASAKASKHIVYPYSVVPGGVVTPEELRAASERDPLVALHYAGFDFRNARVMRLKSPRLVYLSYRQKGKIFWTKRQVKLCAGEQVLTDGKMVARTRCANRVSATPQAAISAEEPAEAEMERPVASGGTALRTPFPVKFESALLRQAPDWFDPADPPTAWAHGLFAGNYYPITFPPPLPGGGGACEPQKSNKNAELESIAQSEGSLKPKRAACPPGSPGSPPSSPPPGPPATIPEPQTFYLLASGIVGIYLCYRKMGRPGTT